MPLIEVKAVDRRFDDPAVNERLIATLTDAACQVWGEEARPSPCHDHAPTPVVDQPDRW